MIDLHCHTKVSDNSLSIEEVILLAKEKGVTHLAITDHDTTAGLQEAIELGERYGIEIIPGIEISAYDFKRQTRAHILGFYVTPGHQAIYDLCQPMINRRHQASINMVAKIIEAGYEITWEEVEQFTAGGKGVYKQHIMHALLEKGYTDHIYGELYKKLFSRGGAAQTQGIAFESIEYIDVFDAIKAIREAGGVPVLAHPGQFNNFAAVPEWVQIGLEGIEVKHPLHAEEEERKASELADQFNLVQTGGTDFHGFYGEKETDLGSKCMGLNTIERLKQRQQSIFETSV
ncbi:PHP domain-containing protein [Alkalihalobacterium chitinilyticum]|uniref:PHP domain-containing protein n=1 Tax=Alkalihalobacterium chitinilyticum TaxID=2980103 RepID=A0ABT5VJ69_9BACI|nr:PHP domain-containing protein [Alkalihalobacterium chitinilyticum]MDE5414762.1 PHP domain-containing protein [Alkalihalobacterium chitinilyticum]